MKAMQVAENIKKLRELKGYTQEYMAEKIGISCGNYTDMETDEKSLTFEKIEKVATVLDIAPLDLLNFSERLVFNNCKNNAIFGNHGTYNNYSEKERELYESRIKHLEEEIVFLKNMVSKLM